MGTYWHKPSYVAADRDADGEIRATALRPGIYCEDEAALAQLRRGARVRSVELTPSPAGAFRLHGEDVYLCTPEQAAAFRATATVTSEQSLAEQQRQADLAEAAARAVILNGARVLHERIYGPGVYGPDGKLDVMANLRERQKRVRVPEYQAPAKPNRAARRAAAAQRRSRP